MSWLPNKDATFEQVIIVWWCKRQQQMYNAAKTRP
jgi:hypothetical protein